MIVIAQALQLAPSAAPLGTPVFGLHTLVTRGNVTATSEDPDHPASNLANPATFLRWNGLPSVDDQFLVFDVGATDPIDYVGIAGHNFGTAQIPVSVEARRSLDNHVLFCRFDGEDGATSAVDESPSGHSMTFVGNAQLDTTQKKFGTASLMGDGSGDVVTTPDLGDFTFGAGEMFTISVWVRPASLSANQFTVAKWLATGNQRSWALVVNSNGSVEFAYSTTGASSIPNASATGLVTTNTWYHLAATRDSTGTIRLFLDGVVVKSFVYAGAFFASTARLSILGADNASLPVTGHIDQLEIIKGVALWTANFTPPERGGDDLLVQEIIPADDAPLILRWSPVAYKQVRVRLQPGLAAPRAAVVHVGKLLVAERGTSADHIPINQARIRKTVTGKSESGNFLGRITTGESRATAFSIRHMTEAWYDAQMDPFIVAAGNDPFFFAWRPLARPRDVGYCWITNDPQPTVDFATDRRHIELQLGGVAS